MRATGLLVAAVALVLGAGAGCNSETAAAGGLAAAAQPPRGYSEPKMPPACATLVATKTAINGSLSAADEAQQDTERIQAALDACAKGQAVKLTAGGRKDAFLAGPLNM